MKRTFSPHATVEIRRELRRLLLLDSPSVEYREAMRALGKHLAKSVRREVGSKKPVAIVTTPEDADFLTRGMLEVLPREDVRLACYWTERAADVATVVQAFVDPQMPKKIDAVVIVKSVIATGCIVRTHLERFLKQVDPKRIIIAAPVMRRGADKILRSEFDEAISSRFEFVTFAKDGEYQDGILLPGVGGRVEMRLGLGRKSSRFSPALIDEWRDAAPRLARA